MSLRRYMRRVLRKPNLDWKRFPLVIHMDTCNYCGPKYCGVLCEYCFPQWYIAKGKDYHDEMPMSWIDWMLREVSRDGKTLGRIAWFFNGDGLCEQRLHELVEKSKRWAPWVKTETFTCGTRTDDYELLVDRNLDNVSFTISAHNQELYRRVHRGDRFQSAIDTLKLWLDHRAPNQTGEIHLVLTDNNYRYAQEWWDYFGTLIDGYEGVSRIISPIVTTVDNLPALRATKELDLDTQDQIVLEVAGAEGRMWMRHLTPQMKPCNVFDDLTITCHGDILQCCNWCDYETWNYGNIQTLIKEGRPLKEVWMQKLANKMRNPICDSCNQKTPDWRKRLDRIEIVAK